MANKSVIPMEYNLVPRNQTLYTNIRGIRPNILYLNFFNCWKIDLSLLRLSTLIFNPGIFVNIHFYDIAKT